MKPLNRLTLTLPPVILPVIGVAGIAQIDLDKLLNQAQVAIDGSVPNYPHALRLMETGLQQARQWNDPDRVGQFSNALGVVSRKLGNYQDALNYLKEAVASHQCLKNICGTVADQYEIGNVYDSLGQYGEASKAYQDALDILSEGEKAGCRDEERRGMAPTNLAMTHLHQGKYQLALKESQEALKIQQSLPEDRRVERELEVLSNLGILYRTLGDSEKALDYLQRALMREKEKDGEGEGTVATLINIGNVYNDPLQDYQTALCYYQEAQSILDRRTQTGKVNPTTRATLLGNIGDVYNRLGQPQEALKYLLEEALPFHRQPGTQREVGMDLYNLGTAYQILERYLEAHQIFQESLEAFTSLKADQIWLAYWGLAATEAKRGDWKSAETNYDKAIAAIETLRSGLVDTELKLSFMQADKLIVYDESIAPLQNLHPQFPTQGYDRKALEMFEHKQGRVFLEQMGRSMATRFTGVPEDIYKQDHELEQQVATARKQVEQAKGEEANKFRDTLTKLETAQREFEENTLKTKCPQYYQLKHPQPITVEELQKMLQDDEALLTYNVRKPAIDLWLASKQDLASAQLPLTESDLNQLAKELQERGAEETLRATTEANSRDNSIERETSLKNAINDKLNDFLNASEKLYQQLFPKCIQEKLAKINPKMLYVVPTGALYSLPFEALVTKTGETPRYLVHQNYAISYLSSASLLKVLREAKSQRHLPDPDPRQPLLAFANPAYDKQACTTLLALENVNRAYFQILGEGECFSPLFDTGVQAQDIADGLIADGLEADGLEIERDRRTCKVETENQTCSIYLGELATKKTVLELNEGRQLDDFQYILFAAHGIFFEKITPLTQPALVLSLSAHDPDEAFLTMGEVFGLQLNADLVTLSACNTGRGELVSGEGVMGLTRAFMYAGTPTVAVTLWSIESGSMKELTTAWFKELKQTTPPISLAEGLRQAKLALLQQNGTSEWKEYYRHPYFWAGMVVFGEGR